MATATLSGTRTLSGSRASGWFGRRALRPEWALGPIDRLRVMGRVVTALMLRETKTRFGRSRLGYLWAVLEPMLYIGAILAVRSFLARGAGAFGDSIILFLMTGLITVRIFLAVSGAVSSAIQSNKALLTFPPVKPVDVLLARFLLESMTMLVVAIIFYAGISVMLERSIVPNHLEFATALMATFLLAGAVGAFNAVAFILSPAWQRLWGLMRLPLLILSGVFYLPSELPAQYQDILWWNPLLHCVEWTRTGTYVTYNALLDPSYLLGFSFVFLVLGLGMERLFRFRLLSA